MRPCDVLCAAARWVLQHGLELLLLVLLTAIVHLLVGEDHEHRLAVLAQIVAVAGHRPLHLIDDAAGVLPNRGGSVHIDAGDFPYLVLLVLHQVPAVLARPLVMVVCRVGVEVLDALVLHLAGIGHTHGDHVTVLVE